jgi:hypothetical protein
VIWNSRQMYLPRREHEKRKACIIAKLLPFFYHLTGYLVGLLCAVCWALSNTARAWEVIRDPWEHNNASLKACSVTFTAHDAHMSTPQKIRKLPHLKRENSVTGTDTRDKLWQRNWICSFLFVNIITVCSRTDVYASIRDWIWYYWHWNVWISCYCFFTIACRVCHLPVIGLSFHLSRMSSAVNVAGCACAQMAGSRG